MTEIATVVGASEESAIESGELPEGWARVPLRGLLDLRYGKALVQSNRQPGQVPVFGSNGVVGHHIESITEGPTIVVGRKGSAGEVHYSPVGCWPIDTTYYISEFGPFDCRFLFYLLKVLRLQELEQSSAIPGLSREQVYDLPVPLPPLAEQKRIVAEIDRLVAEVNKAREHLDRVPKLLKRFRQSILAAACSGKLTADWSNTHQGKLSGDYSLERILNERQEVWEVKRNDRYKAPAEPDDEDVGELPDGWIRASVDQLTTNITSGSRDWSRYYGRGSGTFIMAQNVRPGRLDLTTLQPVDPPATSPDRARSQVERGDLLVTIVGANTGDVCVVESELPEHYVCQSVALMRPTEREVAPYLGLYLNSPMHGQAVYHRYMYGEGRPHLSFEQLKRTPVHLPTPEEQAEIVRRAKGLLAVADEIGMELEAASRKVQAVPQAILDKAFRGDLVPTESELARTQNRPYESAAQLLARVQASMPEQQMKVSRKLKHRPR